MREYPKTSNTNQKPVDQNNTALIDLNEAKRAIEAIGCVTVDLTNDQIIHLFLLVECRKLPNRARNASKNPLHPDWDKFRKLQAEGFYSNCYTEIFTLAGTV